MGCQSEVVLGDSLVFTITCHDPSTGILTDADSAPTYRVYESETGAAISTGSVTKLDDVNTTGFYSESLACTTANGFEDGKSYTIYVEATVGGSKGGISFGFRAMTAVWSEGTRTLTQSATAVAAAVAGGTVTIHRGDSLSASITGLGDISARSKLWFTVKLGQEYADTASIIQIEETAGLVYLNGTDASARHANGSITVTDEVAGNVTIALDEIETDDLNAPAWLYYDIQMLTSGGTVTTLSAGSASVTADVTRVVA